MKLAPVALAAALLTFGCSQGPETPPEGLEKGNTGVGVATAQSVEDPIAGFSRKRALKHVRELAGRIGIRERSTAGEYKGSRYIAGQFRTLGYEVKIQKFEVDGGTSRNVVAWWPGAAKYGVVVGGHMDSVPGSPGANDNASGVAVMLEVARLIADQRPAQWIRFAAFGAEEYGDNGLHHVGSDVYVARLGERGRDRLGGMLSVDMVADGNPLVIGTAQIGPERLARDLADMLQRKGIANSYEETCDCSDNGPFERAGIPAAFMWSGDEPNYHDPSDTPPNLSPKDLKRSGRAVRFFVKSIDRSYIRYLRKV